MQCACAYASSIVLQLTLVHVVASSCCSDHLLVSDSYARVIVAGVVITTTPDSNVMERPHGQ